MNEQPRFLFAGLVTPELGTFNFLLLQLAGTDLKDKARIPDFSDRNRHSFVCGVGININNVSPQC